MIYTSGSHNVMTLIPASPGSRNTIMGAVAGRNQSHGTDGGLKQPSGSPLE